VFLPRAALVYPLAPAGTFCRLRCWQQTTHPLYT
jgi:hypothetical protein